MQQVAGHDSASIRSISGFQHLHGATAPVDQRAVGNVSPHAGEDLVQAIQGKVVVELGDQDIGQRLPAPPCCPGWAGWVRGPAPSSRSGGRTS
jgi:hypothetical protein